jgi:EAL domain-containing protein (putative c-di-GMP-specific phosphodiesterase class I)/GGDEF domain-containing protein
MIAILPGKTFTPSHLSVFYAFCTLPGTIHWHRTAGAPMNKGQRHPALDWRRCASVLLGLLLSLSGLLVPSAATSSPRIVLADSQPRILLNKRVAREVDVSNYLEVLEDRSGHLTLADVMADGSGFHRNMGSGIQTGLGENVYWVRGKISRSLTDPSGAAEWLLLVAHPQVREARLFVPDDSDQALAVAGLSVSRDRRMFLDRMPVFPLNISQNTTLSFYLRIQMDGVANIPIRIWNRDAYFTEQRMRYPVWGLLLGGILALALYNFFIYLSLRETAYLHLSGFLFAMLIISSIHEGFFGLYLTGMWPALNVRLDQSAHLAALAVSIQFTRSFLSTAKGFPLLDGVFRLCQWITGTLAGVNLLQSLGSQIMQPVFWGMVVVFASSTIMASMNVADRGIRFFVAGWSLLLVCYLVYLLSQFGLLPVNQYTLHGKTVALCALGLSLSLGLAAQIQKERFEKQRALVRQQETVLELKYSEDQLQKKVLRDTLQGFPGIETLKQALSSAIASARGLEQPVVLVLLELHHMDAVERQLGHSARDELVTRATKRLSVILRGVSGVMPLDEASQRYIPMAVMGDGSYGFVLRGMPDASINHAIEEVERAMTRPFYYQGIPLQPGISFGLARLGEQGDDTESLWLHAQLSLHADLTKNLSKLCEIGEMDHYNARNIVVINELRSAIHEDQISLYFQPVYDLRRHHVCSLEVFSRWESFAGEKVSPAEIFYLAEVGGFVSDLTLRVIEKALRHFVLAVDPYSDVLKLSVNLSPKCLRDDHFLDEVGLLLAKYRLPAHRLSLEIKESAIIEDPSINADVLNRIRNMGVGLIIDEFGATYSNASYLSSIPVAEVKLDQRLVAQLDDGETQDMVKSLISLCADQNIKLVVHGVEDETTLHRLEQMGCNFAQGHYLSAPVLARDFKLPRNRFSPAQFQRV